jgi:hypothetical protein
MGGLEHGLAIASLILAAPTVLPHRSSSYLGIGSGGIERLVFYPALLWALSFGSHLTATEDKPRM